MCGTFSSYQMAYRSIEIAKLTDRLSLQRALCYASAGSLYSRRHSTNAAVTAIEVNL